MERLVNNVVCALVEAVDSIKSRNRLESLKLLLVVVFAYKAFVVLAERVINTRDNAYSSKWILV